jgi:hypothetical protein
MADMRAFFQVEGGQEMVVSQMEHPSLALSSIEKDIDIGRERCGEVEGGTGGREGKRACNLASKITA